MNNLNYINQLLEFIYLSPTPYHAVKNIEELFLSKGIKKLKESDNLSFSPQDKFFISRSGETILAVELGRFPLHETGAIIIGAHLDSPSLRLKPISFYREGEYGKLSVEIYGSPIIATWVDRDLGIAGRVVCQKEDKLYLSNIKLDKYPVRISSLAIHLDREVNEKGFKLDKQSQLDPIVTTAEEFSIEEFKRMIGELLNISSTQIIDWDLFLYDLEKGRIGGFNNEFFYSSRIDNLVSCYVIVASFLDSISPTDFTKIMVLFNNEEVGSQSSCGAVSDFLQSILQRLNGANLENYYRTLSKSYFVSVDCAHGYNPNYKDRYDHNTRAIINKGPAIKINASLRYATDSISSALFILACRNVNVPYQYYVSSNNIPTGTTIGPISSAKLGVKTVDVGIPIFSMHSIREMAGCTDIIYLEKVLRTLFSNYLLFFDFC